MQQHFACSILLLWLTLTASAVAAEDSFTHIWGGFGTSLITRSQEQRHNAETAARDLHGTIVPPGATFSFNDLVGARDQSKGYTAAPIITASGYLEDVPGGGICQLASTIYNAGLLSGMLVIERHSHSRAVGHVPPGRDATISSWRKDLKLKNPFPYPLQLRVDISNARLTSSFRAPEPRPFQVEIRTERTALEPETVVKAHAGSGRGQEGIRGYSTITRRIFRKGDQVTVETISQDIYPAPSRIIGQDKGR